MYVVPKVPPWYSIVLSLVLKSPRPVFISHPWNSKVHVPDVQKGILCLYGIAYRSLQPSGINKSDSVLVF